MKATLLKYARKTSKLIEPMKAWLGKRLTAAILVVALLVFPSYQYFDFENRFYDFQVKLLEVRVRRHSDNTNDSIAMIVLDDHALRSDSSGLLRSSSKMTSRAYLANLIDKIATQKPKIIALDFLLDEPADKAIDDKMLVRAFERVRRGNIPLVIATRLERSAEVITPVLPLPVFLRDFEIDKNIFLGHINIETFRTDGVVRDVVPAKMLASKATAAFFQYRIAADDVHYYYEDENAYYSLSFPLQILRAIEVSSGRDATKILNSLLHRGPLRINFTTNDGKLIWVSSAVILAGLNHNLLTNKIVVIGSAFSWSPDTKKTPLSGETFLLPGVAIFDKLQSDMIGIRLHVYALRSLDRVGHNENYIKIINDWILVLMVLFLGCIIGPLYLRYDRKRLFSVMVGLGLLGYFLIHLVLFQYYLVYLSLVRPMGAALVMIVFFVLLKKVPEEQVDTDVKEDYSE